MAISEFSEDMDIIAALSDLPNATDGLSAAQLKAKFDEGGNAVKTYLNDTLVAGVNAHLAENVHIGLNESCKVTHSVDQSIANNNFIALSFDTDVFDSFDMHNPESNKSRIYIVANGKYLLSGLVVFAESPTGTRQIVIRRNGSVSLASASQSANTSGPAHMTVSTIESLAVGDYVELSATQSSGGSLAVIASSSFSPLFMCVKVG